MSIVVTSRYYRVNNNFDNLMILNMSALLPATHCNEVYSTGSQNQSFTRLPDSSPESLVTVEARLRRPIALEKNVTSVDLVVVPEV